MSKLIKIRKFGQKFLKCQTFQFNTKHFTSNDKLILNADDKRCEWCNKNQQLNINAKIRSRKILSPTHFGNKYFISIKKEKIRKELSSEKEEEKNVRKHA